MDPQNNDLLVDEALVPQDGEVVVVEEEESRFSITGVDLSGNNRTFGFQIRSLVQHGHVYDKTNNLLRLGQVIYQGDGLKYVGQKDYFNEPHAKDLVPADNIFLFSIVVPLEDGVRYISSVKVARQKFTVVNVNDPPTLKISYGVKFVSTFTTFSWNSKKCSFQEDIGDRCKSKLVLDGIMVDDVDGNLDYLRVDVKTSHGILTLNRDNLPKAIFASCSNRSHHNIGINKFIWDCKGTGFGDREMTFLARPLDLNSIFMNMTYESLVPSKDLIEFKIYDGAGGECISLVEHIQKSTINSHVGRPSIHNRCAVIVRSQSVDVVKDLTYRNSQSREFPWQLSAAILFATLVVSTLTIVFPIMRWLNARKERNLQIAPDVKVEKRDLSPKIRSSVGKGKQYKHVKKKKASTNKKNEEEKSFGRNLASIRTSMLQCDEDTSNDHPAVGWKKHFDKSSGEYYFENILTRRVTWTEPR